MESSERRIGFASFSLHTVILTSERCRQWDDNRNAISEDFFMLNTGMSFLACECLSSLIQLLKMAWQ